MGNVTLAQIVAEAMAKPNPRYSAIQGFLYNLRKETRCAVFYRVVEAEKGKLKAKGDGLKVKISVRFKEGLVVHIPDKDLVTVYELHEDRVGRKVAEFYL